MNFATAFEITQELPNGLPARYTKDGTPIFTAYGCVLLERWVGKGYAYKAVNLKNGRSVQICNRTYPLKPSSFENIAAKIRTSGIADMGRFEIDMQPSESISYKRVKGIQHHIFKNILPEHGYVLREKQLELADHILDAMSNRNISLSEAGVGIGKTHAYLIASAIIKRGVLMTSGYLENIQVRVMSIVHTNPLLFQPLALLSKKQLPMSTYLKFPEFLLSTPK